MTDTKKNSALADPVPAKMTDAADYVLMPAKLTADNGAKAVLSGEFAENITLSCPECDGEDSDDCEICGGSGDISYPVTVGWTTIKRIYEKAVEVLAAPAQPQEQPVAAQQQDECFCDKSAPYSCTPCWNGMQAPQQEAGQARELPPVKLARSESRPGLWLDENGRYYELAYQLPASGNWLTNEQIDMQVSRSLEAIGGKIESATPYREVRDFARNLVRALWAELHRPEKAYHETLQRIGHLLNLPTGSDVTTACEEAIRNLKANHPAQAPQQEAGQARELPEAFSHIDALLDLIDGTGFTSNPVFEAAQIFLECARAARPAQARELSEDEIEALMHKHGLIRIAGDDPIWESKLIWFARDVEYARAALASAPAQPTVPEDVAKDAARYRWLRESADAMVFVRSEGDNDELGGEALDRAIDAAIAAAAPVAQGSKEDE